MSHHLSEKEVSFPHIVSVHGISVKIYRGKNNGYSSFFVHWHDAGGRCCKRCATFEKAQDEADIAIQALLRGQTEVLNLTNDDRLTYLRSQEYLKPLGIRLDQACREYAEVRQRLGDTTLIEAVRFYGEHRPDRVAPKMVSEVVAELLHSRERDGRSEVYLKALRTALGRFAAAFPRPILTIKRREIDEYLRCDYVGLSARSRNNAAGYIRTLFSFAKNQDYLFQDRCTEATKLAHAKEWVSENEVLTPGEMSQLIVRVSRLPSAALYVALGGFAGLRTAEIKRLTWDQIDLEGGNIKLKASITKTMARRVVPILDNLKAFLLRYGGERKGFVVNLARPEKTASELLAKDIEQEDGTIEQGIKWKHNALRHSYISYRLAMVKSLHQVAIEAGNSHAVIQRHYYETVSEAESKEWFALFPPEGNASSFTK